MAGMPSGSYATCGASPECTAGEARNGLPLIDRGQTADASLCNKKVAPGGAGDNTGHADGFHVAPPYR